MRITGLPYRQFSGLAKA